MIPSSPSADVHAYATSVSRYMTHFAISSLLINEPISGSMMVKMNNKWKKKMKNKKKLNNNNNNNNIRRRW